MGYQFRHHRKTGVYPKTQLRFTIIIASTQTRGGGGGVAQSVERATPGEEVLGSISAVAVRSLLVGSVSV